jgi:proteasome assembly chaperone (PAC2) family protein
MNGHLIYEELPSLNHPTLIVAFRGWSDAQEGASRVVRYITRRLPAKRFAEIDPEEFYVFTRTRPLIRYDPKGNRTVRWPFNHFSFWESEEKEQDLLLFSGVEPNLRWRTYSDVLLEIVERCNVSRVVVLGSLIDNTPHTREPGVSGTSTIPEFYNMFEELGVSQGTGYQGPVSMMTVFAEACKNRNLGIASLWAHCPHYLQASPNPKASYALLWRLVKLLKIDVNLKEMVDAVSTFETEINKALSFNTDANDYVRQLEEQYDRSRGNTLPGRATELPSSDVVIQDLEEFLRTRGRESGESNDSGFSEEN